jgi:hypothetical protein
MFLSMCSSDSGFGVSPSLEDKTARDDTGVGDRGRDCHSPPEAGFAMTNRDSGSVWTDDIYIGLEWKTSKMKTMSTLDPGFPEEPPG